MDKISPCLWFDTQTEDAVKLYTSLFKNSETGHAAYYDKAAAEVSGMPQGSLLTIDFTLAGQHFTALNGGPLFKFTPGISFYVSCESEKEIDDLWRKLSDRGAVLMDLGAYPFSKKYGWLADRYGVSWQLNLVRNKQKIIPAFLFVQKKAGKAEEAMKFYTNLFPNSSIDEVSRYAEGEGDTVGFIKYSSFTIADYKFVAMDSSGPHKFDFSQATSFIINCDTQEEVDKYWDAFSKGGEVQQCGWVLDKYGIAWQVVPTILGKLMQDKDPKKAERVMKAMLSMVKLDIKGLQDAYEGK